jgi:hypothetical protein
MHIPFVWKKLFKEWSKNIELVTYLNSRLINTLLWVVALLLLVIGMLFIIYGKQISDNSNNLLWFWLLIAVFWAWRALWQIFYFYKINIARSKIYLKLLTFSMVISFIFISFVAIKQIIGIIL